jgi:hypothetical protein
MVKRSAIANDQMALRDVAGSMGRALLVMFGGDVFYRFTYGLGGGIGITGVIAGLLVLGYWIYCHVRLQRFLYNAAYFMNEPHNLPTATALVAPEKLAAKKPPPRPSKPSIPRPSQPSIPRPSQPSVPPPSTPVVARLPVPDRPVDMQKPPAPRPAHDLPPRPSQPASSTDAEPPSGEPRFLR